MSRPLKITEDGKIQEFSDADLERLVYEVCVRFAYRQETHPTSCPGTIEITASTTNGRVAFHTAVNTESIVTDSTPVPAPSNDGNTTPFPDHPDLATQNRQTYTYTQTVDASIAPSLATDTASPYPGGNPTLQDSYFMVNSNNNLQIEGTESGLLAEIINEAVYQIKSGHEVGSWRISSTTPTEGGAGYWKYKGGFYYDARYNDVGSIWYSRYLKTQLDTPPGEEILPLGYDFNNEIPKQLLITPQSASHPGGYQSRALIVLLSRYLMREIVLNNKLRYSITANASETGRSQRGFYVDTRFNQIIESNASTGTGLSEVYIARSTPNTTGTTIEVNREYLHLA